MHDPGPLKQVLFLTRLKFLNGSSKPKDIFFHKNRLLNKMIPKKIFPLEKMHHFLKVSTTFYKEISEIISTIVMKEIKKYIIFTQKVKIF